MRPVERSPERDAALLAMLPYVAEHGWTTTALRAGSPEGAEWLFSGAADMIELYLDLADRRMAAAELAETRLSARVRALIATRLEQAEAERPAVRRAAALLALPANAALAARTLARTVDAIWHAAGDRSADMSWYTKRATLAAVYGATLLYWMNQGEGSDPGNTRTLDFLDRRLASLGTIGKLRSRLSQTLTLLIPSRLHSPG
jgi:ubiquinone biosynthesis protein COQ9